MSKPRRRYSKEAKAEVLAWLRANGGNVLHTARQFGLPEKTVARFVEQAGMSEELRQLREEKAENLAGRLDAILDKLAKGMLDEEKIKAARLGEVATAFGIFFDKRQLLRGEPTVVTREVTLSPEQKKKARELRLRLVPPIEVLPERVN